MKQRIKAVAFMFAVISVCVYIPFYMFHSYERGYSYHDKCVYVTENGDRFHAEDCFAIYGKPVKLLPYQRTAYGEYGDYRACPICKPDERDDLETELFKPEITTAVVVFSTIADIALISFVVYFSKNKFIECFTFCFSKKGETE